MPFAHETQPITMPMVGYAYVPMQTAEMRNLYDPEEGLEYGSIFPILVKPLGVYGKQVSGDKIFPEVEKK
ncbi:spore coat associated protein CotJA [Ructibacterium gallinarum]|uniref:spore coat associated protein CotJA n=1 Tax=Ructibacterium gallinarum TaxID=2779355 RepID=UPI001CF8CDEC|nr:spore coat associated protein CotJA [Ructibacterium gallinarum]